MIDVQKSLKHLVDKKGLALSFIAIELRIPEVTVRSWYKGSKPRYGSEVYDRLPKLMKRIEDDI